MTSLVHAAPWDSKLPGLIDAQVRRPPAGCRTLYYAKTFHQA
jgi:hypothetical protein